jgi:hydrogenase/urease accessory protein HupE
MKFRGHLPLMLLLTLAMAPTAFADVFRPAYLELTQIAPDRYEVLWKVPALDETTMLGVRPGFPDGTVALEPARTSYAAGAAVQRWRIAVPGGFDGKSIKFEGLSATGSDLLVRLVRSDGTVQLERVLPASPTFVAIESPGAFEVVQTYTVLGVEHILTGFDHLLFVLSLVLIVRGTRRLIWTVTAFTVAHSVTLALATLGVIHVPGPPVEAIIALSIMFVANEIIHQRRGTEGLAARQPWLVAFSFGLLHGLGFAGALAEVGLPENAIALALLFFNVGVEVGQLLFIAAVLACGILLRRVAAPVHDAKRAVIPLAYAIGGIASFWFIERLAAF